MNCHGVRYGIEHPVPLLQKRMCFFLGRAMKVSDDDYLLICRKLGIRLLSELVEGHAQSSTTLNAHVIMQFSYCRRQFCSLSSSLTGVWRSGTLTLYSWWQQLNKLDL